MWTDHIIKANQNFAVYNTVRSTISDSTNFAVTICEFFYTDLMYIKRNLIVNKPEGIIFLIVRWPTT